MSMKWNLSPLFPLTLCACILGACTADLADPGHALALPPSLQGTEPDGNLHMDQHGRFVADADAMRFFDYFLTAEGEMPDDALHALVHEAIARRLHAAAAAEASEAFERYQDYRAEAARIIGDPDQTAAHARDRLLRLHTERVAHMPGLAADPILFDRAAALHRILIQPDLDRQVRAARIAEIERVMPMPGHDRGPLALRETHLLQRLHQAENRLRARGGSAAELHALRADLVGPAAAERLARLDEERAAWQQRVMIYQSSAGLEAERFTPRERLRLRAHVTAQFTAHSPAR